MPQAPGTPCTVPGCPEIGPAGKCPKHKLELDKQRPNAHDRGYDREWREEVRAPYLAAFPYCQAPNCEALAIDVHHRDGQGPQGDNTWPNLEGLCHSHHSRHTASENIGFNRHRQNQIGRAHV